MYLPDSRICFSQAAQVAALIVIFAGVMSLASGAESIGSPQSDPYVDQRSPHVREWRRQAEIEFPDGSSMPVALRRTPPVITVVTDSLSSEYSALRSAIDKGNAGAAFALYLALKACRSAYPDASSLQAAIDELHSKRILRVADASPPRQVVPDADLARIERDELRDPFGFCFGVTSQQKSQAEHWRDVAIAGNDAWAINDYAQRLPATADAASAWRAVWRAGSITALSNLAKVYHDGRSVNGGGPDLVRAYAYSLLNLRLLEAAANVTGGSPMRQRAIEYKTQLLIDRGTALSSEQRLEAAQIAWSTLAENEACCYID